MATTIMDNMQAERYLTTLAEMEHNWQSAVDKALSVREDQLATAKQVIVTLRAQIQQLEVQLEAKNEEVDSLKRSLLETQMNLDSTREDMATLLESSQKQLEVQNLEHVRQLDVKNSEIDDLRTRHKLSIQELARGARETLQELEVQLDEVRLSETDAQRRLAEAQGLCQEQVMRLQEWDRVSEKMCRELDEVKGKLKSSKFANGKLREEIALWKKYAEKVEEERKTIRRDIELEKKVLQKFNQVDSFLRTERQHRNSMLTTMNNFGIKLIKDLKHFQESKHSKVVVMFAATQTEMAADREEKRELVHILQQKSLLLEEELKKREHDLENLSEQNATLREVILGMKKERESWEREREQMDEEVQVTKLEESVRLIKNNFMNGQKDNFLWSAIDGVKKEVSDLKNRKVHNAAKVASKGIRPTVIGKPVMKTTGGVPVIKEYVVNRGQVPLKF